MLGSDQSALLICAAHPYKNHPPSIHPELWVHPKKLGVGQVLQVLNQHSLGKSLPTWQAFDPNDSPNPHGVYTWHVRLWFQLHHHHGVTPHRWCPGFVVLSESGAEKKKHCTVKDFVACFSSLWQMRCLRSLNQFHEASWDQHKLENAAITRDFLLQGAFRWPCLYRIEPSFGLRSYHLSYTYISLYKTSFKVLCKHLVSYAK